MNEILYIIRELRELAKRLGYELSLEDARILAEKMGNRMAQGDGIIKV